MQKQEIPTTGHFSTQVSVLASYEGQEVCPTTVLATKKVNVNINKYINIYTSLFFVKQFEF